MNRLKKWLILCWIFLAAACTPTKQLLPSPNSAATDTPVRDSEIQRPIDDIATRLQASGATVTAVSNQQEYNIFNELFASEVSDLWDVVVNGEPVQVYAFTDDDAAQTAVNTINRSGDAFTLTNEDGTSLTIHADYVAGFPPRYWRQGRFIIYYTGQDEATLNLLDNLFGARIADGDSPDQPYEPGQGMAGLTLDGISLMYDPYLAANVRLEPYPSAADPTQLRLIMESLNLHQSDFTPMIVVAADASPLDDLVPGRQPVTKGKSITFQNGSGQSQVVQTETGETLYTAWGETNDGKYSVTMLYPVVPSGDGYVPALALLDDLLASLDVNPTTAVQPEMAMTAVLTEPPIPPSPTPTTLTLNVNLDDISDWQTLTVDRYGFTLKYPPAFEVVQWDIHDPDWDSYSIIESAIKGTDPQLPAIGFSFRKKPSNQPLRGWFEAHTRALADSDSDDPIPVFYDVSHLREIEVAGYPALMFQDEGMVTGIHVLIDRTDHIVWLGYPVYEIYDLGDVFQALLGTIQFASIEGATLDTLPFQPGTSWIYERTEYDQIPGSTDVLTHTLLVTETAVSVQQQPPYTIIEMRRQMPDTMFASTKDLSYWYILDGQTLYRQEGMLNVEKVTDDGRIELVFPLTPGASWHSLPSLRDSDPKRQINSWLRRVERLETVETPAGAFEQCAYFTEVAAGNYMQTWYCPDVGFVQRRDDHAGTRFGYAETLIAIKHQKTEQITPSDGLIYQDMAGYWRLVLAGHAALLTEQERQQFMQSDGHHFAVRGNMSYTIQDNDVWATNLTTGESHPLLETADRAERRIFGLVGDWLLVESFQAGEGGQGVGPLVAIPLSGSNHHDAIVLVDNWLQGIPAIAPDGRYAIYPTDEGVFAFHADSSVEALPFDSFASASFSPDGRFIALHLGYHIEIVNLESSEVVHAIDLTPIPRDSPPGPPQWHPNNKWIAFEHWNDQTAAPETPITVRLLNIETGETHDIAQAAFPQWRPDGQWLAYVRYGRSNETHIVLAATDTWAEQVTPFIGQPSAWVDLP